jgi:membrane-bound lytic murein transglycosylase A
MPDMLSAISFEALSGWQHADLHTSLQAFQRSAQEIISSGSGFRRAAAFGGLRQDWLPTCEAALAAMDGKAFFENHFLPLQVSQLEGQGSLFTGYYEPILEGTRQQSAGFPVPVYQKPDDLVAFTPEEVTATGLSYGRRLAGKPVAYDTREAIENGSLHGQANAVCWLKDWVDAFFMHVQGQGRVRLQEGGELRLSYAGKTGHSYTGIGGVLIAEGVAPPDKMSMQVLRGWMQNNPARARTLMWNNKSYIFFNEAKVEDPNLGGIGAAKVNLTPGYSLAVDRSHWMFGTPLWVDTTLPPECATPSQSVQRLMLAQDTGSAIRGIVRGDFFWGWGETAATIAGHMKSQGTMVALLPKPVVQRLGLAIGTPP